MSFIHEGENVSFKLNAEITESRMTDAIVKFREEAIPGWHPVVQNEKNSVDIHSQDESDNRQAESTFNLRTTTIDAAGALGIREITSADTSDVRHQQNLAYQARAKPGSTVNIDGLNIRAEGAIGVMTTGSISPGNAELILQYAQDRYAQAKTKITSLAQPEFSPEKK